MIKENKIKNSNMKKQEKGVRDGFTLIELIITISMIMILLGIVIIGVPEIQKRGRDSIRIQDLDRVANALENYYNREGHYPDASNWSDLTTQISEFLGEAPYDPRNQSPYIYSYCDDNTTGPSKYALMAKFEFWNNALEEDFDEDWPDNMTSFCDCGGGGAYSAPDGTADDLENSAPYAYCIRNP